MSVSFWTRVSLQYSESNEKFEYKSTALQSVLQFSGSMNIWALLVLQQSYFPAYKGWKSLSRMPSLHYV